MILPHTYTFVEGTLDLRCIRSVKYIPTYSSIVTFST